MFQIRLTAKIRQVGPTAMPEGSAGNPGIPFTSKEKFTEKTSVRVVEKCQLGMIQNVHMANF